MILKTTTTFLFSLLAASLAMADIDIRDEDIFPADLFPELEELSDAEVVLHGLNALYPERVYRGEPEEEEGNDSGPPLVKNLDENVVYVRAHRLGDAVPVIRENLDRPVMILDLRYVASDLDSTVALGEILTRRSRFHFYAVGDYPLPESAENARIPVVGRGARAQEHTLFTLINHETSGPVEVLLEQLRRDAETISIGTRTAGRTASFRSIPDYPEWRILSGELRPDPDVSLVDDGFVPRVTVTVEPEYDRVAYGRLTEGVELGEVVQTEIRDENERERRRLPARLREPEETEPRETPPPDLILQRAVNIVKALQALGQIPG